MRELIRIEDGKAVLDSKTSAQFAEFERVVKEIKAKEDEVKAQIKAEMEEKNIIKIETPELLITYVAESDRETFQTKKFKEEHPDLHDEYIKMSPVKSSIRVKVREEK